MFPLNCDDDDDQKTHKVKNKLGLSWSKLSTKLAS